MTNIWVPKEEILKTEQKFYQAVEMQAYFPGLRNYSMKATDLWDWRYLLVMAKMLIKSD